MGIYVKFTKTTHQIWSCHVSLVSNSENFYFSPKLPKFGGNWLKNKNVTGKIQIGGGNPPPPPPPSAYRLKIDSVEYVWSLQSSHFLAGDYIRFQDLQSCIQL